MDARPPSSPASSRSASGIIPRHFGQAPPPVHCPVLICILFVECGSPRLESSSASHSLSHSFLLALCSRLTLYSSRAIPTLPQLARWRLTIPTHFLLSVCLDASEPWVRLSGASNHRPEHAAYVAAVTVATGKP